MLLLLCYCAFGYCDDAGLNNQTIVLGTSWDRFGGAKQSNNCSRYVLESFWGRSGAVSGTHQGVSGIRHCELCDVEHNAAQIVKQIIVAQAYTKLKLYIWNYEI